jgi:hypothetical protein
VAFPTRTVYLRDEHWKHPELATGDGS